MSHRYDALLSGLKRLGATPVPTPPGPRQWVELFERMRSGHGGHKASDLNALETGLGRALERDELRLVYQPSFETRTGRITGAEALLRWQHPDLGLLQPAEFIPYAEDTGVILPLSRWVLRQACSQASAWEKEGLPALRMAVNLTAHQFSDPHLITDAIDILDGINFAPERLELDITESMMLFDCARTLKILRGLKAKKIHVALDDFGIGYSSLSHLQEFPVDVVKIARSVIHNVPGDYVNDAITEAIIEAGKKLHIRVVAKGVETATQVAFLRRHRCDNMQGFFFSEPLQADDFAKLMVQR